MLYSGCRHVFSSYTYPLEILTYEYRIYSQMLGPEYFRQKSLFSCKIITPRDKTRAITNITTPFSVRNNVESPPPDFPRLPMVNNQLIKAISQTYSQQLLNDCRILKIRSTPKWTICLTSLNCYRHFASQLKLRLALLALSTDVPTLICRSLFAIKVYGWNLCLLFYWIRGPTGILVIVHLLLYISSRLFHYTTIWPCTGHL